MKNNKNDENFGLSIGNIDYKSSNLYYFVYQQEYLKGFKLLILMLWLLIFFKVLESY